MDTSQRRYRLLWRTASHIASGVLVLAIVSVHFTGMTAFRVEPLLVDGSFSNPAALHTQALAVEEQLANLIALGCGTAQGFLLGKPVDASAATRLVEEEGAADALAASDQIKQVWFVQPGRQYDGQCNFGAVLRLPHS